MIIYHKKSTFYLKQPVTVFYERTNINILKSRVYDAKLYVQLFSDFTRYLIHTHVGRKTYVETSGLRKAKETIEKHRKVILTGIAGSGKSKTVIQLLKLYEGVIKGTKAIAVIKRM